TRPCCNCWRARGRCRGETSRSLPVLRAGARPCMSRATRRRWPSVSARSSPRCRGGEPGGIVVSHALASLFIAGIAFCGSHTLLSSTRLRGSLRDQLGEQGFLFVYSLTALVTFAWFVVAYARAPIILVWVAPRWTAFVPV